MYIHPLQVVYPFCHHSVLFSQYCFHKHMTYVFVIFTCNLNLLMNLLLQYNSRVIRLCLSIWNRSPDAYSELSQSGMIKLPSGRLLQYYKNAVPQHEGFNEDVLHWMEQEATNMKLSKERK